MATDYGTDVSTFVNGGLDPNFSLISGGRVVAENVARRLITRTGTFDDAPTYGTDLMAWINSPMDALDSRMLETLIRNECLKDERVETAYVNVTEREVGSFNASVNLYLVEGESFTLTLSLTSLLQNVEILKS